MDIRSEADLRAFLKHFRRIRRLMVSRITVSRRTLPPPTEVLVLRQPPERTR